MRSMIVGVTVVLSLAALHARAGQAPSAPVPPGEVERRAAQAKPGETIVLADGTYADQKIVFRARGTEGKPVTLRAATPGKVVLTGKSSLEVRGAWLVADGLVFDHGTVTPITVNGEHCRVTNCAILQCNPPDDTRTHWIRVTGGESRRNRIDHCFTEGKTKDGVVLTIEGDEGTIASDTLIDHNHFKDVIRAVPNGMETIRTGDSKHSQLESRTVVEANLFENASGDAEIISNKSCGNVYRYNTFRGSDGGLTMRHGHRATVVGNFFFGDGKRRSAGIRLHGSDHQVLNNYMEGLNEFCFSLPAGQSKYVAAGYEPTLRALVAFNTVVEPGGPAFLIGGSLEGARDTAPTGCQILNNVVSSARGVLLEEPAAGSIRWAGNLFFARPPASPGAATGHEGIRLADPVLERAPDSLWRPAAASPLLGAGVTLPKPPESDMDGQPRGERRDVGADQRSTAPITYRPLSAKDVGPGWRR